MSQIFLQQGPIFFNIISLFKIIQLFSVYCNFLNFAIKSTGELYLNIKMFFYSSYFLDSLLLFIHNILKKIRGNQLPKELNSRGCRHKKTVTARLCLSGIEKDAKTTLYSVVNLTSYCTHFLYCPA